jgi:hypothetical protein
LPGLKESFRYPATEPELLAHHPAAAGQAMMAIPRQAGAGYKRLALRKRLHLNQA